MRIITLASALALVTLGGAALAQSPVQATTNLNVRAGPGPQYPVIGVIGAGQEATLKGCIAQSKWCSVAEAGGDGWVYSDYLTGSFGGNTVVLSSRPTDSVAVVEAPRNMGDEGAIAGGATGAIAGAIVGGPIGAVVGGAAGTVAGGAVGSFTPPPESVRTYIAANPGEPVYLDGEVVEGATLPETVVLREVPDYEYRYVNVNGQEVLIEPGTRRVVYIVR
ncbi:MAG: DUF1236 domain-containing protein [Rhizobiaceae bacterium]|nr:DUF1236 domain-containing protein [Rhizobiaceae bacterium]